MVVLVHWSELPSELLELIALRLLGKSFIDYKRFSWVCRSWRSAAQYRPKTLPPQTPWLLLPDKENNRYCFSSISREKFHLLGESDLGTQYCCGSSQGWLLVVHEETLNITLTNPITRVQFPLPHVTKLPMLLKIGDISPEGEQEYIVKWSSNHRVFHTRESIGVVWIKKVAISSHPTLEDNKNCTIMVMCWALNRLVFCKLGQTTWTPVEDKDCTYCDLAYWNGQFYAVDEDGRVVVCDLSNDTSPKVIEIQSRKRKRKRRATRTKFYHLVESSGELLLIKRHKHLFQQSYPKNAPFRVFKRDGIKQKWIKIQNLDNHTLFFSCRSSFSLLSSSCSGFKRNCIYFTIPVDFGNSRSGIYNLEDGTCEPFHVSASDNSLLMYEALWITPSPW